MSNMGKSLGFDNCLSVGRNGMGGGLALLWNHESNISIVSYSNHHIDAVVNEVNGKKWRCTGIYGHPESMQKRHTWTLLRRLAGLFNYPWLCFGDFNEILNLKEKLGGNDRCLNMVAEFREAVNDCSLVDLRCKDHSLVMLEMQKRTQLTWHKKKSRRRFHYEDMWSPYETCKSIVKQEWMNCISWRDRDPVNSFKKAANNSMAQLLVWSKKEFNGRKEKLNQLKSKLSSMKGQFKQFEEVNELRSMKEQIERLLLDEEVYWKQRSRADCPSEMHIEAALVGVKPKVDSEINNHLNMPFTAEESLNSLVAKVLKARYFKHDDFMNARLGSKPSFIWRSVLWGRQVIQKGSRWRIGNGENVKVYKSNWIPRPSTFRPISAPTMAPDTTVAELIDSEQHWKEKLICDHFRAEDAKAISQIPLPRRPHDDQLIWHYDKRGQYSVKSGYQVAMKIKFPDKPSCSTRSQWNVIWKLAIPKKIKIFLWRATHDLLPTAGNLWKRRILQESTCQICCCKMESISHALLECKMAKKIWKASQITVDSQLEHNQDIIGLLQVLPQLNANIEGTLRAGEQKQWCPPPRDWLKINVDAAVDAEKQVTGLGVVIRDSEGKCKVAAVKTSKFFESVVMAEAAAMEWGLQVTSSIGVTNGVVESNSLEVVELINKKSSNMPEVC
ncbi:putative reverse transcriptase/RNA-dependent DNA polymerase [Citrus sinensis]|nr:putative reverse transcriptase/RNA-dependent DNA polymerase [Citrus sinensis]